MRDEILDDILSYVDFLRECGYHVVLSCFHERLTPHLPRLLPYEPHMLRVCAYLKSQPDTRERCLANKACLIRSSPDHPYYGCCWAGVEEYIFPIRREKELICCVHVSGYRGRTEKSQALRQKRTTALGEGYAMRYAELQTQIPKLEQLRPMLRPLGYMCEALFDATPPESVPHDRTSALYIRMLAYIQDHYPEIRAEGDIANALNYSLGYLRSVFQSQSGTTLARYVRSLRLKQACQLLTATDQPITEIALSCGFADSNYFSTAFKAAFGMTPGMYRKKGP